MRITPAPNPIQTPVSSAGCDTPSANRCAGIYRLIQLQFRWLSGFTARWKKSGHWLDKDGVLIEDFNLPLNLMLSVPVKIIIGDFRNCKIKLRADINGMEYAVKTTV
jgi:hypothetical protein